MTGFKILLLRYLIEEAAGSDLRGYCPDGLYEPSYTHKLFHSLHSLQYHEKHRPIFPIIHIPTS